MLEELLVGIQSVLEAGEAILKVYDTDFDVRMKSGDDPVTDADISAHNSVAKNIEKHFPEDLLLSEEDLPEVEERIEKSRVWILDPLDGTRDFVERNPEFAVCLGFCIDGKVKLGMVYNPVSREVFWGMDKFGFGFSTLDNSKISSFIHSKEAIKSFIEENINKDYNFLKQSSSGKKIIIVSRNEMKNNLYDDYLQNSEFTEKYSIISKGSIAYKLGLLARGDADLVVSLKPKNEWDICGGIGILNSMGYLSFEISTGKPYSFNHVDTRTYGLIAGRKEDVESFWKENKSQLQKSLKNWDGSKI